MRLLRNPMNGFKYAIEGLVHVFRTQRHMRFHFLTLVLVLVVSLVFKLAREEVIILLFTISLVLMAEMFTAIEASGLGDPDLSPTPPSSRRISRPGRF